jgi:dienelactone hydrolase
LLVAGAALLLPETASATIGNVLAGRTISGQAIPCIAQSDGVRVCHGTDGGMTGPDRRLKSFDGIPLELYVILPPAPGGGTDGHYPLVVQSHGWGGSAGGPADTGYLGPSADAWAKDGYAVLQLTARGFGDSCGQAARTAETPIQYTTTCINGYIHLDDDRYEVRDIQYASGLLVDAGIVDPAKIGATGDSYGGGVTMQLATLKDRVMNANGSLSPWKSPGGTSISVAAGAPVIPWSDLVNSLEPNGRTLDYQVTSPTADLAPIGVLKQSFVAGLFALGAATGYYSTTDPNANLPAWYAATNAGEPYDSNPEDQSIATQIARYHSAYYLLDGAYGTAREPPAPLLIANGFTDDLFPVDEAVRYYNLDQQLYPANPIALFDGDFGHMRAQNKAADTNLLSSRINSFFDHYVKGGGPQPPLGVTAFTETCPASAPSGGPLSASTWAGLHPGEVDHTSKPAQTIVSSAGDPTIARAIDPVAGGGACATVSGNDQGSGVATYRLPTVTGNGYTLLGSPTVIATLNVTGQFAFIAARLWDLDKAKNTETLVARGVYRIDSARPNGLQVFQLHPGAWHFAAGHIPKLELLGQDAPYVRTANGASAITVSGLELRLPVHETPGGPGVPPVVTPPKPPVKPHAHAARCVARPFSRINEARTRASRSGIVIRGTAGEHPCAHISRAARHLERVAHVFVMVYRPVGSGRCRFLEASGKLSRPRSCSRPLEFLARGKHRWILRLRFTIPAGRYVVRVDAVDGTSRHQRRTAASTQKVRIR